MPVPPISVQLYTVREALAEDLPGTLSRLVEVGYTQVEPFALSTAAAALGPALADAGLAAPTAHQHLLAEGRGGDPGAGLDAVFAAAAALGVTTVVEPHVDAARWQTRGEVARVADELGAAAAAAARHGVRVGYHNHAHELASVIDGTPALEVLAGELDDAVVLEVDTYWAAVGGVDPVALLTRLGRRVAALHLKDGPGTPDPLDQVAVGSGAQPIEALVGAAPHALRVVELDDTRGDRLAAVADSLAWLRAQGLA